MIDTLDAPARPVMTGAKAHQKLITAVRELPADLDTPAAVYLRLAGHGPSFLLESVTGGEHLARYSFIGVDPRQAFVLRDRTLEVHSPTGIMEFAIPPDEDPMGFLRQEIERHELEAPAGMPRLTGGLVGYLGYETMRFVEPKLHLAPHPDMPDAIFVQAETIVAFDHAYGRLLLIASSCSDGDDRAARERSERKLDELERRVRQPLDSATTGTRSAASAQRSNLSRERFMQNVEMAKEHIAAGDIFQVVLSQRFSRETSATPFEIYRALRRLNPSPYMFFFDLNGLNGDAPFHLIGASPEVHVRLEGRNALLRPIAGTRPRSSDPQADDALEQELLDDPKERAEHVMLVDLARNDLGRVCEYGTVHAPELMTVERYSHVMHIVSQVEGKLRAGHDGLDLVQATFPAGTVSGAPKIRAMEIISELEPDPRGVYAGAVGYFSYDGSLDTCIAIRTLVMQGQTVSVQAGAGIVADSDPAREYQETVNKATALLRAVDLAESIAGEHPEPRTRRPGE